MYSLCVQSMPLLGACPPENFEKLDHLRLNLGVFLTIYKPIDSVQWSCVICISLSCRYQKLATSYNMMICNCQIAFLADDIFIFDVSF